MQPSLLTKILGKKEEEAKVFLALEICPETVRTAACQIKNGEAEILATASRSYQGSWEEATLACDQALAEVEGKFPRETPVDKVVLGLPSEYTQEGKIEPGHLANLHQLLEKLSLKPLGFVELPLAIINLLAKQEGGPQTLILVRVGKELAVSLVRIGKITHTANVPRSADLAKDLEKVLTSFSGVEILPSRILLYDGQAEPDLENVKQQLMNHPWLAQAAFLHFPKIETLAEGLDIQAVAFAGASETAQAVEIVEKTEAPGQEGPEETFGFVKEEDILERQPEPVKVTPAPAVTPAVSPKPWSNLKILLLEKILLKFAFLKNIKKPALIILLVAFLLILFGGLSLAYWYLPKAEVDLMLEAKNLQESLDLTLNKEIPAISLELEEKQTRKMVTTGRKTVGDPAKGEVTIYNLTNNSKTFKKGTILASPNNLKFTLDDEVSVASASTGADYTKIPGKQNAHLTAAAIGPEGNLGVGQEFHFADYPTDSYVAKNSVALSGGTSREISVVSRSDQERILASASAELKEQANKDLAEKLVPGEKIFEKTLSGVVTAKKFNKEVDEEASELTLDLSMKFTALGYKEDDLLALLEKLTAGSVPTGFEFRRQEVQVEVLETQKQKDGNLLLKINFTVALLPKINENEIKKNLAGKSLKEAEIYLKNLGNMAGFEVKFSRRLPFLKENLPRREQNIEIATSSRK